MHKQDQQTPGHIPAELATSMSASLRQMGDPVRAHGAQEYFKNEIVAIGITTPVLRRFVKQRVREARAGWELREALQLCDLLLREEEMEIRSAGILALAEFRKQFTPELLPCADRWLEHRLDNWALVDLFCGSVLSMLLRNHPEVELTLRRWSGAKSLWKRRASLVTLIPCVRHRERLEVAYGLASDHFGDPEDLMHKATGWLLRETGKADMARLRRFLLANGPRIPRTALRYSIERFSPRDRAQLLAATRPRKGVDGPE
jgi:3-methyladenine DNA glycosylase AlkD